MELHDWVKFFHILGAIVWVGAGIVLNAVISRAHRSTDRSAVVRLNNDVEWVGPRLIGPSAVAVIGLGIWLVFLEEHLEFSQTWIVLSLVLVGISMILGMGYFGPEGKRISGMTEARGAEDPEAQRRMARLLMISRLDVLILVAVLWLMVFKPGA